LQPLAFYAVRLPLDAAVRAALGLSVAWGVVALFYAPLIEEPAKWLVLALPAVRRALAPANAVPVALAIGLGFGLGEVWFLTQALVASPNYPDLPFWRFYGFVLERLEVCLLHGVFIALPVARMAQARSFWPGALAGVALHFVTNFPIYPAQIDVFRLGGPVWSIVLMAWTASLTAAGAAMLVILHRRLQRAPAAVANLSRQLSPPPPPRACA
jgi:RsiW-degrading membrane proteinase PrsW (M82 family)